jgi:uncharacterized protein GlcG (DUF336 family)
MLAKMFAKKPRQAALSRYRSLQFQKLEDRLAMAAVITAAEAQTLVNRAAAASARTDAIIAVVDRGGHILAVRTESSVVSTFAGNVPGLVFSIDGAVALARTAAFFSSDQGPITSRTVREISQSTITQREVESSPDVGLATTAATLALTNYGPGLVAPIGPGGLFPPGVDNTGFPDLFGIEYTNRDSVVSPGPDGIKTTTADNVALAGRFNASPVAGIDAPESYGFVSGLMTTAQARGIGTLAGGVPIYKNGSLVGGIGVFFPGPNGYATYMQGFVPNSGQTDTQRMNSTLELTAEWMGFAAIGGAPGVGAPVGTLSGIAALPGYSFPIRTNAYTINLGGITLDELGPNGTIMGLRTVMGIGNTTGRTLVPTANGTLQPVNTSAALSIVGQEVPSGYLVAAHAGGSVTTADVTALINQGIAQANLTRSQLRLLASQTAKMVFAVSDTSGNILGLYRMPDAPVFSIDVAVAKARNDAYYDDKTSPLVSAEKIATAPAGAAFTSRTYRYLADPRFPQGIAGTQPGPWSSLNDLGINPRTAENVGAPLPASAYANANSTTISVFGLAAFLPNRNFRDPNDIMNQNGVVFFPGSTALYRNGRGPIIGGYGVSGDGVNQDDLITYNSSRSYLPDPNVVGAAAVAAADTVFVRGVRLPSFVFPRNGQRL